MDWDDLRYFLAVARGGSLSAAARKLNVSASTVSRRLSNLEQSLSSVFFVPTRDGYVLTPEGQELLVQAETVAASIDQLEFSVAGRDARLSGHVKLATAENLANFIILPELPAFREAYPDITLEILTGVHTVSLAGGEPDLAVRLTRPESGQVNLRKLGRQGYALYGLRAYVEGRMQSGQRFDPTDFDFIGWNDEFAHLPAAKFVTGLLADRAPMLRTQTLHTQFLAATRGIGIACLPCFMGDPDDRLIRLSAASTLPAQDIWMVLHSSLSASARVRVVANFLADVFRDKRDLLSGEHIPAGDSARRS